MTIFDEHTADLRRRLAQQNPPTYVGGSPKNTRRTAGIAAAIFLSWAG
ncbi:MAG: hypothetical protein ACRCUY_09145 [Thermoguttaceae bacterium]